MGTSTIRILDPGSDPLKEATAITPRVPTIGGKRLGLLSNGWRSFDHILKHYTELAKGKYEAGDVLTRKNPNASSGTPQPTLEELATVDAAVVGIGH
ncbi:hypothetical protein M1O29_00250 [Dehalococcoidia bacterium]|nr:hypothetical protein [Dehalococcoidia bacterium]